MYLDWGSELRYIFPMIHWLAVSHSVANPIIYCFMNDKFRAGFTATVSNIPCMRKCFKSSTTRSHRELGRTRFLAGSFSHTLENGVRLNRTNISCTTYTLCNNGGGLYTTGNTTTANTCGNSLTTKTNGSNSTSRLFSNGANSCSSSSTNIVATPNLNKYQVVSASMPLVVLKPLDEELNEMAKNSTCFSAKQISMGGKSRKNFFHNSTSGRRRSLNCETKYSRAAESESFV